MIKKIRWTITGTYDVDTDEHTAEQESTDYENGEFTADDLVGGADEDSVKVTFEYVEDKTA